MESALQQALREYQQAAREEAVASRNIERALELQRTTWENLQKATISREQAGKRLLLEAVKDAI